jgi:hypothetical protein
MRTHLLLLQGGKRRLIVTLVNNQRFLLNIAFGPRTVLVEFPADNLHFQNLQASDCDSCSYIAPTDECTYFWLGKVSHEM